VDDCTYGPVLKLSKGVLVREEEDAITSIAKVQFSLVQSTFCLNLNLNLLKNVELEPELK